MMRMAINHEWVNRILAAYDAGQPLLFLFDYDGTLTPIVRHPSLAVLASETRDLLRGLSQLPDVRVAVVSGRALDDLRNLVPIDGFMYAGSGGLEVDLDGVRQDYPGTRSFGDVLTRVHSQLIEPLRRFPGTWVERKPAALSIHFRGLVPVSAMSFRSEVTTNLAQIPQVRFRVVSEAIEVTPVDGWDKGTAVKRILDKIGVKRMGKPFPIYFGDSPNDDEGMSATVAAGGIAVGIGPDAPNVANYRIAQPEELIRALKGLRQRLAKSRGLTIQDDPATDPDADDPKEEPEGTGLIMVDPESAHRDQLTRALRRLGWRVWACSTTLEADRILSDHGGNIRVALVDLEMPGLLGARVLADWEQGYPDIMRCAMATVSPYLVSAFKRLSDIPLFRKPIQPAMLDTQLRHMLQTLPVRN